MKQHINVDAGRKESIGMWKEMANNKSLEQARWRDRHTITFYYRLIKLGTQEIKKNESVKNLEIFLRSIDE